ncbi:MAG: hypothetical protein CBB67_002740 [Alteromonadaceae bacterium TMED7]|nr:MAG: hypothetical protein CBB67_002740 [Alteromonadaceae bacterium TMED7]
MIMKAEHWWSSLTLIILIVCAVIFGYLQSVDTANPRSLLNWSQSQWISTESAGANGYFRHSIELDNAPQRAVLHVSGTDHLQIFANGKTVKTVENRSVQATAVLDLSRHLQTGSNVLAFELHRSSFPAMVALRYELTVIDALGQRQTFISDAMVKSQSLYPQTTSRQKWFDKGYDDAFWTSSVPVAGDNRMAQVTTPPELLLALPSPPSYVLDASQHWSVSLSTTFNYAPAAEEQVWLAVASDVPYEAIINGISGGIFSPSDSQLHLNSVLPRLKDGENSIEINLMNNGVDPVVAGGLIRQNDYQVTTTFISPDWQIHGGGGSGHSALEDIRASSNLTQVRISAPAVPLTYAYIVNDNFTPPAVAQSGPWLQGGIVVLFILLIAPLFKLMGISLQKQLTSTCFANAIAILCLVAAWFMAQDVRFDARQIFSVNALQLMLIVWMLMVIVVLAEQAAATIKPVSSQSPGELNRGNQFKLGNTAFYIVSAVVALAAFLMRLHNIDQQALTVDEATIAGFARGVVERGYPYLMVGGMEVELATYELVPYFLAASVKTFGYSDFALRIPAVLFGTSTCLLIIYCGSAWFGRLTGLIAGVLYAISPWAIYWGKNCFHPSQIQFFNLVALIAFYRLLASDRISLKLACLSALAFTFSYLSWEGSGLVLPIMAFVALVIRWQDWRWFFQPNLWIAAVLIIFVVAAQGIRRSLLQEPFIMVGFGKSDLATPKLTFTQPSYEPWYYINNFFFTETHIGLSLFFLLGLIFMFYDRKLSFVVLFVVMAYLSLTNLLGYYNAHYFYFVLPVFLLAVAAVFVKLLMLIQRQIGQVRGQVFRAQGVLTAVLIMAVLVVPAGAGGLHLYRLMSGNIDAMRVDYRPELAGMDGRSVSLALAQYWRESDVLITSIPLLTEHYVDNKGDYFVQTITDRKVVYDTVKQRPYYVDKFVGNPVLRNKQELQDVLSRHDRVFFVAAPVDGLTRIIDAETLDFINQNMRVVAESYDSRLYVWER